VASVWCTLWLPYGETHIAKIIDTYQFRKEEERYSKRVSMERITEEGYNLNISRYISTAVSEQDD
jgi:type I restriction enzyme M protein